MKSNVKLSLLLFIIVAVVIGLLQAGQKQPINWRKTYNPQKKNPYDTYVLKHELKKIYQNPPKVTTIKESLYMYLANRDSSLDSTTAILFVGSAFYLSKAGRKKMLRYIKRGGTAFLSATYFGSIIDSFQLERTQFNMYLINANPTFNKENTVSISLYKSGDSARYNKIENSSIFDQLPDSAVTLLGNFSLDSTSAPNFVAVKKGKGQVFFHLEPQVFTNYYLLQDSTFSVAINSLQYLKGKNILWYDNYYKTKEKNTPLRFILSQPPLRWAWYILLIILLIYIVFQSRREQRAIPIELPEPNRSVDFAKTIGSLYYENGEPGNMIHKKIDYFLFAIRQHYQLKTDALLDKKFIESIQQRTGIKKQELEEFFFQIDKARRKEKSSMWITDLKYINTIITQFKQEANMN